MKRLGHFRILGKLGQGGMGVVYKAEDERLRRVVALKVLPPEATLDARRRLRFVREAQAAAAVTHPALAAVHEIGEHGGVTFIAMEYVEGPTLAEVLAAGPLPVPVVLRVGIELAEGLDRAHRAGVVHRDLKPSNVIVQPDGHVKILDFGVAKRVVPLLAAPRTGDLSDLETSDAPITGEGTIVGTLAYMSPEQVRGDAVDGRSDLFTLGIVLYEMLTNKDPFRAKTSADTISAILNARPAPVTEGQPEAPPHLGYVIDKLLAKEPAERYATGGEVAADLRALGDGAPTDAQRLPRVERARSIAVLPFSDMSAAKDQDYFCEGMAEELINALTQIRSLRVAARTSAFQFKGREVNVRAIAQELGVDTLLQGSVRKAGDRLRVTAQLVSGADGYQVWSQRFDRKDADVFELQDEITATIVEALRLELTGDAGPPRPRRYTQNLDAYHLYLKGRWAWFNRYEGGLQKAIQSFQGAIDADPDYCLAHSGLADCYAVMGMYGFLPPKVAFAQARGAAERALALDDSVSDVHSSLGFIHLFFDWDWTASEQRFRRALAIDSGNAQASSWYSLLLSYLERHDEALATAQAAVARDPLSHYAHAIAGQAHKYAGRYAEAAEAARRALDLDADFALALYTLGQTQSLLGEHDAAIATFERTAELSLRDPFFLGLLGWALGEAGRQAQAAELLAEVERAAGEVAPFSLALLQLGSGDAAAALDSLERSFEARDSFLASLGVEPMFRSLRDDPRFAELKRRLRLPGA